MKLRVKTHKKTVDIVTSAFNEQDCLEELYSRISKTFQSEYNYRWRLIICDNNSEDKTWQVISSLNKSDKRVVGIKLSRNFLFDNSITCGLDFCTSDLAIVMCSDLQDPPEVIPRLLREFEAGNDQVVVNVSKRTYLNPIRRVLVKIFYYLINRFSDGLVRSNVPDFRLMSRKCYEASRLLRERKRFMRGIMAWSGFKTTEIHIERAPRTSGISKFGSANLFKVISDGLDSIFSFSIIPIRLIMYFGLTLSFLSLLALMIFVPMIFVTGIPFAGFGTIVSLLLFGFSSVLGALGIVGTYVGLIYEEVKARPIYVIEKCLGI